MQQRLLVVLRFEPSLQGQHKRDMTQRHRVHGATISGTSSAAAGIGNERPAGAQDLRQGLQRFLMSQQKHLVSRQIAAARSSEVFAALLSAVRATTCSRSSSNLTCRWLPLSNGASNMRDISTYLHFPSLATLISQEK